MVTKCIACSKNWRKEDSRSFHRFPKTIYERNTWLENLNITNEYFLKYKRAYLCSDHFSIDCFWVGVGGIRHLKYNAVPSLSFQSHEDPGPEGIKENPSLDSKDERMKFTSESLLQLIPTPSSECSNTIHDQSNYFENFENTKMNEICRCCMKSGTIDLKLTFFNSLSLAAIIEICTHTSIMENDNLPMKICMECCMNLKSYYLFLDNFQRVQIALAEASCCIPERIFIKDDIEYTDTQVCLKDDFICSDGTDIKLEENTDTQEYCMDSYMHANIDSIESKKNAVTQKCLNDDSINSNEENLRSGEYSIDIRQEMITTKEYISEKVSVPLKNIKMHINEVKSEFNCLECDKSFPYNKWLWRHCRDTGHSRPRIFQCDKCTKNFSSKKGLRSHLAVHRIDKPYSCGKCCKKFKISTNLKRHMRTHTGEKPFNCDKCGKEFSQKTNLTAHLLLHTGERPYICEKCGKGWRTVSLLHHHLKTHPDLDTSKKEYNLTNEDGKYECKICNRTLTKHNYFTHMEIRHRSGIKKYSCNTCGKRYSYKITLNSHMKSHNLALTSDMKKQSKNHECFICSKSFSSRPTLEIHQRIHSGEKPHSCEICGKTFRQKCHLRSHMKIHTGEKPYSCKYCDRSFAFNGSLKDHMIIHTGEAPHKCRFCGKGFLFPNKKEKHESTVHRLHKTKSVT